jgi:hypothetical protein
VIVGQRDNLEAIVQAFRQAVGELSGEVRALAEAHLKTVQAQLASPRPNERILREALRTMRSVAEGAAGSATFAVIVEMFKHLRGL